MMTDLPKEYLADDVVLNSYKKLFLKSWKVFWQEGKYDIKELAKLSRNLRDMPTASDFEYLDAILIKSNN